MRTRLPVCLLLAALALPALPASAGGGVMMQYFHWYLPADGSLWRQVAAGALLHVRTRTTAPVSAFEIVLVTSSRSRGGQFLMTPSMASQVADGGIELSAFYVQNVQY